MFSLPCHNTRILKFNLLTKCTEDNFVTSGFFNWKHETACYRKHDSSASHCESLMKWIHHTKGVSVDAQLSSEKQQQQARKRIALGKTVSSLLYLGCQGQSFRGHDDTDGNFMCLLQL